MQVRFDFMPDLLFGLSGILLVQLILKMFSDFFLGKVTILNGRKAEAKIIGFYNCHVYGHAEFYSVVEYLNGNKKAEVIVARANRDKIGDKIIILADSNGYAVRYFLYYPYRFGLKIQEPILCGFVTISSMIFINEATVKIALILIWGIALYFIQAQKKYKKISESKKSIKEFYGEVVLIKNIQIPKLLVCQGKDEHGGVITYSKEKSTGRFYEEPGEMVRIVCFSGKENEYSIIERKGELDNTNLRKVMGIFGSWMGMQLLYLSFLLS